MRDLAVGMWLQAAVVCVIAVMTLSPQCSAADLSRARRGVVAPGSAAFRPKGNGRGDGETCSNNLVFVVVNYTQVYLYTYLWQKNKKYLLCTFVTVIKSTHF